MEGGHEGGRKGKVDEVYVGSSIVTTRWSFKRDLIGYGKSVFYYKRLF